MANKLGHTYKKAIKDGLKQKIEKHGGIFIVRYKGLKSAQMTKLRKELKKAGARISIIKNKLTRALLDDLKLNALVKSLEGPTAFVFSAKDPVLVAKALMHFAKENEKLNVEVAFVEQKLLDKDTIKVLSSLPSREVLLSRVIGGMKAPLNGLGNVLSGTLRKMVLVVDAIARKKQG